jgi:tRNA nucleotidyltransferase (CCA-adding enzyme)
MGIKILDKMDFAPEKKELSELKKETANIVSKMREVVRKGKISAEVFVGGSYAKDTLIKKDKYDIDIFVRFDWKQDNISDLLEKILKKVMKDKLTKIHGSRDYFRMIKNGIYFEIVPVTKIKKPEEARNVTDLSYFHVNYVKKRTSKKLAREIRIAKRFCKAQEVYGAESYIKGFSGYGLECLMIYYKSFEKMLKELSKAKERVIIDQEKIYKKKSDVLFELNESKLKSPVVLVDPTWKERNVLAALSKETFKKFQEAAKKFLKKPSEKFFEEKEINIEDLKKESKSKKAEFLHVKLKTERQKGDIAGSKLKKFGNFLTRELSKYFEILKKEFSYDDEKKGDLYLILRPKKESIKVGPPVKMKDHAKEFKKRNKNVFEKAGILHSRMKVDFSAKEFMKKFKKEEKIKTKDMSISEISL